MVDIKEHLNEDKEVVQYLLASIGAPILGEIAKPIFGKIFRRGRRKRRVKRW